MLSALKCWLLLRYSSGRTPWKSTLPDVAYQKRSREWNLNNKKSTKKNPRIIRNLIYFMGKRKKKKRLLRYSAYWLLPSGLGTENQSSEGTKQKNLVLTRTKKYWCIFSILKEVRNALTCQVKWWNEGAFALARLISVSVFDCIKKCIALSKLESKESGQCTPLPNSLQYSSAFWILQEKLATVMFGSV